MKLGMVLPTMGAMANRAFAGDCARAAEDAGVEDLWVVDHLAIPRAESEGSDGYYLEQLTTLAWIAGRTERIGIGTAVLVLPYRPPLQTAKQVATLQELSGGRLRLGVGVGWMKAEFAAAGVERSRRGAISDETLRFLGACFREEEGEVECNGQPFLFRPRPPRPPIYVGGTAPHALRRAVRHGDGWMPMGGTPEDLRPQVEQLQAWAREAGREPLEVVAMTALAVDDPSRAREQLAAYEAVGATRLVHGHRYAGDAGLFRQHAEAIGRLVG